MLNTPADRSKSLHARIVRGSVVLLSGSTLASVVNFSYNIAVARFLGPKGFGQATAVYTLLTILSAITLSFQIITAKFVAQQSSEAGKSAVYRELHRAAWVCGTVVALLLLLFQHGITGYLNLPTPVYIEFLAVGAAFYIALGTRRGFIQGAYGFRSFATNLVLEGLVRLGGSVLLVLLGFGVTGVIAAQAMAMAVAYFAIAPKLPAAAPNPIHLSRTVRELAQALVFFSGQVLINNCDIVLVKHFFLSTEAGIYAAIAMVGRVIFSFSSAVTNSMFPVVAGTRKEERRSIAVVSTSMLLVLGIGLMAALALRLAPARIWTAFFGAGFRLPAHHGFPFLLAVYAITTVVYALSVVVITFEMSYKIANTSWLQLLFSGAVVAGICRYHSSLEQVILVQLVLMIALFLLVGIPFLREALRESKMGTRSESNSFRLLRRISEDEVIAEFLRSDFEDAAYGDYRETLRTIVHTPDLESPNQCATRRALFYLRHLALWREIPPDTVWYELDIRSADLRQVHVFPRTQWRRIARGSCNLREVVEDVHTGSLAREEALLARIEAIRNRLAAGESISSPVLLIGLNESEPLTIIDGNHRLLAAALEGKLDRLRFLCGLSPRMTKCCWYRTNLLSLTRYGANLLRHLTHQPEAELERLVESSG